MSFWDKMTGFFWGEESLPVLIMVLAMAMLLLHFRRDERASLINTVGFFFVCLFGQFVSGVLHALDMARAAGVTHEVFVIELKGPGPFNSGNVSTSYNKTALNAKLLASGLVALP